MSARKINWLRIFDWRIKDVSPVTAIYKTRPIGQVIAGYKVTVTYMFHGQVIRVFKKGYKDDAKKFMQHARDIMRLRQQRAAALFGMGCK